MPCWCTRAQVSAHTASALQERIASRQPALRPERGGRQAARHSASAPPPPAGSPLRDGISHLSRLANADVEAHAASSRQARREQQAGAAPESAAAPVSCSAGPHIVPACRHSSANQPPSRRPAQHSSWADGRSGAAPDSTCLAYRGNSTHAGTWEELSAAGGRRCRRCCRH